MRCRDSAAAGRGRWAIALAALAVAIPSTTACSRPVKPARVSRAQPVFEAEVEAAKRQSERRCSDRWSLLFPGMAQMCRGKNIEAGALMALGTLELGTAITVGVREGFNHPGAALPLVGVQDLWLYSNTEPLVDRALAAQALYAPQESLSDMLAAPFNVQVLKKPEVWAGTLGLLAVGIGATRLLEGPRATDTSQAWDDPNLFGRTIDARYGYPLGIGVGAGLFSHVAIAEEIVFRGALQSGLARSQGEFKGWLWASLAFGLTHSFNAFALPADDRRQYLLYAVPVITALGSYMGYAYQRTDYSLSVPVAIHFWYDLLLSTTFFVLDPRQSPLSASISFSF